MAEKTKIKSKECQCCECEIKFGVACESCVSSERVCQMCGVDISHRDESAMTCDTKGKSCKKTRQRRINAIEKQGDIEGTVPPVPSETEQPASSQVYFRNPMEVAEIPKGDSEEVIQFYQMMLSQQSEQIDILREQLQMTRQMLNVLQNQQVTITEVQRQVKVESVPFATPKIIEDGYQPMSAAEREAEMAQRENEPRIEVKVNKGAESGSKQNNNFLNSFMALQG